MLRACAARLYYTRARPRRRRVIRAVADGNITRLSSAELCNEALALLSPSLESYRGCNIISIGPHDPLWAQKVHEYIQPRRHIVVNPLSKDVENNASSDEWPHGSSQFEILHLQDYETVTSYEFWRDLYNDVGVFDPGSRQKVLVLVNLAPKLTDPDSARLAKRSSPSTRWFFHFFRNLYSMPEFYDRPLPRVLTWLNNADKFNCLPNSKQDHGVYFPRFAQEYYKIREIAGKHIAPWGRRDAVLEIHSALQVATRMRDAGVRLPEDRSSRLHLKALEALDHPEQSQMLADVDELRNLRRTRVSEKDPRRENVGRTGAPKTSRLGKPPSHLVLRVSELHYKLEGLIGAQANLIDRPAFNRAAVEFTDLLTLETEIATLAQAGDSPDLTDRLAKHATVYDQLHKSTSRLHKAQFRALRGSQDNYAALLHNRPPLLDWDRRDFEPLQTHQLDFDNKKQSLALLDFEPRSETPRQVPEPDHELRQQLWRRGLGSIAMHPLMRVLSRSPRAAIEDVLESTVPGAAAGVIPNCPSLFDPLRGGRMTLGSTADDHNPWRVGLPREEDEAEHEEDSLVVRMDRGSANSQTGRQMFGEQDQYSPKLRQRMLTLEQQYELLQAWMRWPFRVSDEKLMS